MKLSLICPSRNNLKYLKWSYDSVQKNKGNHEVEFCVADDFSSDGTAEWCAEQLDFTKDSFKYLCNIGPERLGHTILYDRIVKELATNEVCIIWHADMYLCPGALDAIEKHMFIQNCDCICHKNGAIHMFPCCEGGSPNLKRVVSLTRIEPPLHPAGPEKIVKDYGTEPETFKEDQLLTFVEALKLEVKIDPKTTTGVFAPWAFFKKDFLEIGGHDPLFAPQSKEDSDIWNRMKLAGFDFVQTWEGFVYHMTCRGSRFNPTITKLGTNSDEWQKQNLISTRNFIRKWGHFVAHDEYLNPIVYPKFKVGIKLHGIVPDHAQAGVIAMVEPWCSKMYAEISEQSIQSYVEAEQKNTPYDLSSKIIRVENPYKFEITEEFDILLSGDVSTLTSVEVQYMHQISAIVEGYIKDQGDSAMGPIQGDFELGGWIVSLNVQNKPEYPSVTDVCDPNWKTMPIYRK